MRIERMRASFGCLSGQELSLHEGLNVVCAPNESGKSTWCAFLRAMLYGVDSAERARGSYKPDRMRYAPWSGEPMQGEMDLLWQGQHITLQRRTQAKGAPMRDFSACYTGTADPVPGLTGTDAGQTLTGVTAPVFRRSAFIGQGEIPVSGAPELERRINAIVTSGEEEVSFSEASERLRQWQRARFFNRKVGAIPALDEKMAAVQQQLSAMTDAMHERDALIEQALEADREIDELGRQLQSSAQAGAANTQQRRQERRNAVHLAEQAYAAAVEDAARARAAFEQSPFGSTDPEKLSAAVQTARADAEKHRAAASQKGTLWPVFVFLALCALWIVVGAVWNNYFYSGGVGFFFLAMWALRRRNKTRQQSRAAQKQLAEIRRQYGTDDPQEIAALEQEHARLWQELEDALAVRSEAETVLDEARALLGCTERVPDPESDRLRKELDEARERAADLDRELARATGRLSALGDPVELRSGLAEMIERREELVAQYDALTLAADTLTQADTELRSRFSPALSRKAGALMARLTGGRYGSLVFDRDFSGQTRLAGDAAAREDFYLSAGAADLAYLCLRLAVCELALPGDDPCPLVLDDVLVNLDDERAAAAAGLIRELAQNRQIIFFTCRERDAALLRSAAEPPAAP